MNNPATPEAQSAAHAVMLHCSGRCSMPNQLQIEELIDLAFAKQRSELDTVRATLAEFVKSGPTSRELELERQLATTQSAAAEMREALEFYSKLCLTYGTDVGLLARDALSSTAGVGWLSPEDADNLRETIRESAAEGDNLRKDLAHVEAEPCETCRYPDAIWS